MRKLVLSAALGLAAISAAPATAQYWDGRGGGDIGREIAQMEQRIHRSAQRGELSRREANRLFNRVQRIDRDYDRARRGGISPREYRSLQLSLDQLRRELRWERHDGDRYSWRR